MEDNRKEKGSDEQMTDEHEDERTEIRKELANMSFEEIQRLKDQLGARVFNEAYHGKPLRKGAKSSVTARRVRPGRSQPHAKRSKHAPREESSKARVPAVRDVVTVPKVVRRDPRFDGVSGAFDEKAWNKNYQFVNEMKASEKTQLTEQLRKATDPAEKRRLKLLVQRIQNQEKARQAKDKREAKEREEREENIARLKEGKRPVYKSKGLKKKEELAEKFIELKESGRLDKYLQKKRKKMAGKSKKQLLST